MYITKIWYFSFLVASLAIYWVLLKKDNHRKVFLICASLIFLVTLEPTFTILLLMWVIAIYFVSNRLKDNSDTRRLRLFLITVISLIWFLGYFKYLPGLLINLFGTANLPGIEFNLSGLVIPLGISYFTFRFLHVVIDAYRGHLKEYSFLDFFLYCLFFPIVAAGPIERIERFTGNATKIFCADNLSYGIQRITFGVAKKLLLVDVLLVSMLSAESTHHILSGNLALVTVGDVWFFLICSFLYAYIDFSAYSDIAIGTSRLFGYQICENFNFPIFRRNLSEFWKNWHMSLSQWCRDYVYMPVLGHTRNPKLALYASMITIGLWHYVNVNWVVWGALHATGLVVVMEWQRKTRKTRLNKIGNGLVGHFIGAVFTFAYVSWVFTFVSIPKSIIALEVFVFAVTGFSLI